MQHIQMFPDAQICTQALTYTSTYSIIHLHNIYTMKHSIYHKIIQNKYNAEQRLKRGKKKILK